MSALTESRAVIDPPRRPAEGERQRSRRLRGGSIAVVAIAAVLVGFLWVRDSLAAGDRNQVRIVTDMNALTCEGTSVEGRATPHVDGSELAMPVAAIEPGMRCLYTFWVSNQGGRSVDLDRIVFPVLGPSGGAAVEAIELAPLGLGPNPTETSDTYTGSPIDAIFDVERDLPADSAMEFSLVIVHRPSGCTPGGGTISWRDAPTITLTARGVTGDRKADNLGFGFLGHPTLNCDEP